MYVVAYFDVTTGARLGYYSPNRRTGRVITDNREHAKRMPQHEAHAIAARAGNAINPKRAEVERA